MILYLDTSSLVKLYVAEAYSELVQDWVDESAAVATSRVAYPEAFSALSRRFNRGDLTIDEMEIACELLAREWHTFVLLPVHERKAGELVLDHLLRGFDAVHLAAALNLRRSFPFEDVVFSSFDSALLKAARSEGLSTLHLAIQEGFVMETEASYVWW